MEFTDFCAATAALEGSRDTGAQLFCAVLRAAGVDVRLVCSLQLLPFAAVTAQGNLSVADQERRIATSGDESEANIQNYSANEPKLPASGRMSFPPRNTAHLARNVGADFSTSSQVLAYNVFESTSDKHRATSQKGQRIAISSVLG